ncbi:MAG: hypothetical protein ACRDGG_01485 [Anaerolineae bacterium]
MPQRFGTLLALMMVLGIILAACGGSAGGDPVAVVQEMFRAVEAKQFNKIVDLACEAQKDEITKDFDFGANLASQIGRGIDAQKVLDAMTFKLSNMDYKETSRSGNVAVVHVKGRLDISIDPEKFKAVVAEILQAQGLADVDQTTLDQATGAVMEQFEGFGQDLDEDINVVNENGKWLVCG